jgi:hypothetical protein
MVRKHLHLPGASPAGIRGRGASRRDLLKAVGATAAFGALAGCTGDDLAFDPPTAAFDAAFSSEQ